MCQSCTLRLPKIAAKLLRELEAGYLEVVLIPPRFEPYGNQFRKLRAAQSENAKWYRDFCAQYESNRKDRVKWRKFKTKIKRRETLWALDDLIHGRADSIYAQRLIDFIRHRQHKCSMI